jgi:hypothetical protein
MSRGEPVSINVPLRVHLWGEYLRKKEREEGEEYMC